MLDLPFSNGWDVAGVGEKTGYGVTRFQPGDPVFGMPWFPRAAGGYAEYVTARHLARMPESLSFTEAAALPPAGLTAWQMSRRSPISNRDSECSWRAWPEASGTWLSRSPRPSGLMWSAPPALPSTPSSADWARTR
ncbi:alcohol dehydrogenase catalytic domain-containing protein [Nonomuraea antimicrobica]|uniref:alcohol dehydrogenase catalytic domain-containing protein n=1 Tax=Nonomuraea antimicrobica TaxID=561173 RepID=UPI003CD0726A